MKPKLLKAMAGSVGRRRLSSFTGKRIPTLQQLKRSRIIIPRRPTRIKKKVLFVCVSGFESSWIGMDQFRDIARKRGVSAVLVLDYIGWEDFPGFMDKVLGSDFVVPMYPSARKMIQRAIAGQMKRPLLIDVDFRDIGGQYNKGKYIQILEQIRAAVALERKTRQKKK